MYLLWILLFVISCGESLELTFTDESLIDNELEVENLSEIESDSAHKSSEPVMITGASLTCESAVTNSNDGLIEISCHIDIYKVGSVLDIEVLPSDIEILDEYGKSLLVDITNQDDGTLIIKATIGQSTDIQINLRSIGGIAIEAIEPKDLSTKINITDIINTSESRKNPKKIMQDKLETQASKNEPAGDDARSIEIINCNSISAPGSWISVPGDSNYETNDFCVMKYEAKSSQAGLISQPQGIPWDNISQLDAITECTSLGEGYHLITNNEWMTIASNIADQGVNWDGGMVGTNEMTRGHSDDNPSNACPADPDDGKAYVEGSCTGSSSGTFNQRRTHILSNGDVIWDFAGNLWEWTSYFNDEEKPSDDGTPDNAWLEYTTIANPTATMPLTDLISQTAITGTWNSTESIGLYYSGTDSSGGALHRGGGRNAFTSAGVFAAYLNDLPTLTISGIGFRCAVAVP